MPEQIPQHAIIEYLTLALNIERLNHKLGALRIEIPELTSGDALFTALRWMGIERNTINDQRAYDQWRELIENIATTPDYETKAAATWFVTWCGHLRSGETSANASLFADTLPEPPNPPPSGTRGTGGTSDSAIEARMNAKIAVALIEALDLSDYLKGSRNWLVPRIKDQVQDIINILSR